MSSFYAKRGRLYFAVKVDGRWRRFERAFRKVGTEVFEVDDVDQAIELFTGSAAR